MYWYNVFRKIKIYNIFNIIVLNVVNFFFIVFIMIKVLMVYICGFFSYFCDSFGFSVFINITRFLLKV